MIQPPTATPASAFDSLSQSKAPVVIFGAGVVGEAAWHACQEHAIKVTAFCDNNRHRDGTSLLHTEVVHTSRLKARFPEAVFIIAVIDIEDIVRQLSELGYASWLTASAVLRHFQVPRHVFSKPGDFVHHVVSTCMLSHDRYANPRKIFFHSVDVVITERCSLRCRDCSNLMQYYQRPAHADFAGMKPFLDHLCHAVDTIGEARVIGGEPLMHRQWHLFTEYLLQQPTIDKVVIYTNGTIMPAAGLLERLAHPKLLFIITDYGRLSTKVNALCAELEQRRILYLKTAVAGWTDCAAIHRHGRTGPENTSLFQNCCAKNLFTLKDSRLYRCPFSAHAHSLQAVPDDSGDYVDLGLDAGTRGQLRTALRRFMHATRTQSACDYCNGRRLDDPVIPPAVQADAPLAYERLP